MSGPAPAQDGILPLFSLERKGTCYLFSQETIMQWGKRCQGETVSGTVFLPLPQGGEGKGLDSVTCPESGNRFCGEASPAASSVRGSRRRPP